MAHGPSKADEARFQAESDVRTLVEAQKIRRDKGRMTAARKSIKDQQAALDKVKGET